MYRFVQYFVKNGHELVHAGSGRACVNEEGQASGPGSFMLHFPMIP